MARLAALLPRPKVNLTRFHGVFAPNSRLRKQITPKPHCKPTAKSETRPPEQRQAVVTWAQRLKRVFTIDIETCQHCGGTVKVVACIEDPAVIKKILKHLEQCTESTGTDPHLARAPSAPNPNTEKLFLPGDMRQISLNPDGVSL